MTGIVFQDNHETSAAETITITVRQPWAALIVCGQKQFETTTLPPPASFIGRRIEAELVVEQLRLSGWTLEPPQVLRQSPPNKYGR